MYKLLNELLSDKKSETIFTCFEPYHIIYMVVIFLGIGLGIYFLKNKSQSVKNRAITITINIAFGLYILDFFLMPFAYGEIDLEKLPFHICTTMCVACFLSCHNSFFGRFKKELAILGLVGNIIYVIYPAGVGWYQIHPLSYRVIQTLLFHGVMTCYGIFTLTFGKNEMKLNKTYKELIIIVLMTIWALIGNFLYNGNVGDYNHNFNWFFVIQDPFYILPSEVSPIIMPFVMIIVIYFAVILVYLVYYGINKLNSKATQKIE